MNAEYIVLTTRQASTRDVFSGAAGDLVKHYATAQALSTSVPIMNRIGGLAGAGAAFPESLLPNALPGLPAGLSGLASMALPVPDIAVEVRSIDRSHLVDVSSAANVVAVAESIPTVLLKEMHDTSSARAATLANGQVAWGVHAVGADTSPYTGKGVVVAVLDTGIDHDHPAFAGIELIEEDFTGEGNGDKLGHGTHCAGTIFGRDSGGGRIGIAPGVEKALIAKIIGNNGGGDSAMLAKAIEWAARNGANVLSMSIGFDFPALERKMEATLPARIALSRALEAYRATIRLFESTAEQLRIKGMYGGGTVSIFLGAAGNETDRRQHRDYEVAVSPPANAEGFVSVGALGTVGGGDKLDVAFFSNTGPNVCAPGIDIVSARPGGDLVAMSGTSMATPHAAGVAALWAEKLMTEKMLTSGTLRDKLVGSATTSGFVGGFDRQDAGYGIVRAPQA